MEGEVVDVVIVDPTWMDLVLQVAIFWGVVATIIA
jgi:hypothetical protein